MAKNNKAKAEEIFRIIGGDVRITRDVAIATIVAEIEGDLIEVDGTAQRHPDDRSNPRVASLVAYNRALNNLQHKVSRRAAGAIKHADDMAKLKETTSTKKPKKTKKNSK